MSDTDQPGEPRFRLLKGGKPVDEKRDDELLRAFLVGDEEALGELCERHQHTVHAIVRRYARSADDARDLTQRAFLRVLEAGRRTVGRTRGRKAIPFRPWLIRIAVNLGKNHARDAARWRRSPFEVIEQFRSSEPDAADLISRAERERAVRAAVLQLPKRQREVLTLRIDAELSFLEIASTLRITENNAKVHFHQATKRLRAMVAEPEENTQ